MTVTLPGLLPVRNLFEDLLNREVEVVPDDPTKSDDLPSTLVAIYVNNSGTMVAVLGLNLPLAAHAGAAFGLMPVGAAEAALEDKALSPALVENVAELANIFGSLLNREGGPHVKLHQVIPPGEPVPSDAAAYLLALGRRLDVKLTVSRYGTGRLALVLTD
ncbi:hypothetical protein GCM10010124_08180 [Pilimelia terevasa]|uniref:Uncharacterized protein n=1 Tax=Pilimelia terevasa TaxID=53372 RepID=A0A8J3BKP0_9ACTN|nr:hypothetical protein [Pilimelia terevasa]GGK18000.1 hypothetical protein GCM10010124_08180 [Pilimelia terevasa]